MRVNCLTVAGLSTVLLLGTACTATRDGPLAVDARGKDLSLAVGDRNDAYNIVSGVVNACAFFPYLGTPEDFSGRKGTFTAAAPAGENVIAGNFDIQPVPSCIEIWNANDGDLVPVSASLVAGHPGYELERIAVSTGNGVTDLPFQNLYGPRTGSVNVNASVGGYIWFKFKKVELPPRGGQGCTPGYWRQSHHFDRWVGYSPNQAFSTVFANAFPGKTLAQVAATDGGGVNALGRHSVAALLNASSSGVSFDLTQRQVIDGFNAAFTSGNRIRIEALKNELDMLNNQGCPLN